MDICCSCSGLVHHLCSPDNLYSSSSSWSWCIWSNVQISAVRADYLRIIAHVMIAGRIYSTRTS